MSPATAQPFAYEFEMFDQPGSPSGHGPQASGAEPSWGAAEVEAIRAAAYAEGEAAGRAAEKTSIERTHADAAAAIAAGMQSLSGQIGQVRQQHENACAGLALVIGQTLAGTALNETAESVIASMIQEALERLDDAVRVTIEVHPSMRVSAQHVLDDVVTATGFSGRVILRDGVGHAADCRIDWGDGGIERRFAEINGEIEARFSAHCPLATGGGADQDPGVPSS